MKFSIFSLAVLAPIVLAQNSTNTTAYLNQVLGALTGAGLTSLVSVASAIGNTTNGMALLSSLAQGNKTVFAPNNDAFAAVPSNVSSNPDLLAQVLAYHIINTTVTVNGTQVMPNHTIARTVLNGGNYSLPGNRSQPLVLSRNSTNATGFEILQAIAPNITVGQPVAAANLLVYVVNRVISLPPTLAELATALVPQLAGLVQQTGLLAPLEASRGITVFAPNDAAISLVMSAVGQLNSTQIQTVLANHVINGTVVYSNMLTSSNYTSAAGEPFMFMSNSSGAYVRSGNSSYAKIIRSDLIINNGVVHTIDGVLVNTASDPQAAASAYSSGIAAATSMESQAPLTATSMMSPSGSGSAAASSRAAGELVASFNAFNGLVAAVVGVVGVAVGGGLVLA